MKNITRTVWILSIVSMFTDISTEMLYPVMPIYLKSIGFSVMIIGILEGLAEATTGLSKGYFGKLSDNTGKRLPFVRLGYALSTISKPLMILFIHPVWVFVMRTADRFGKGIRTGARDAILSDEATPATKARIFGFHRSMDTLGAVLGPLLALIYLFYYPKHYKALFLISFVPGTLAVLSTFLLKDRDTTPKLNTKPTSFFSFLNYWKSSPSEYRKLVTGLLAFALFNSSDVFLLLKAKQSGLNDTMVIGLYIFYNLVYASFSYPMGVLGDKIGLKNTYLIGLSAFAFVYLGMGLTNELPIMIALFLLYGIFSAATEGISKAWITNITDTKDTATAIGTYSGFQSIATMVASSVAGFIWYRFGASTIFLMTGTMTLLIIIYFAIRVHFNDSALGR